MALEESTGILTRDHPETNDPPGSSDAETKDRYHPCCHCPSVWSTTNKQNAKRHLRPMRRVAFAIGKSIPWTGTGSARSRFNLIPDLRIANPSPLGSASPCVPLAGHSTCLKSGSRPVAFSLAHTYGVVKNRDRLRQLISTTLAFPLPREIDRCGKLVRTLKTDLGLDGRATAAMSSHAIRKACGCPSLRVDGSRHERLVGRRRPNQATRRGANRDTAGGLQILRTREKGCQIS